MAMVKCGAAIRHADMPDNIGTLGCLVQSRSDPSVRYLLTAAHVIGLGGYARSGDSIEAMLGNDWVKVAEFERAVRLHDAPGALQVCDAAIARIVRDDLVSDEIEGLGVPGGIASGVWPGMRLQFRGAGSGQTIQARVESTGNPVPVIYEDYQDGGTFTLQLDNQILYGLQPGAAWATASQPGDSGALVMDNGGLAVGLHVGRTPPEYELSASVCTPLEVVLQALDVVLPGAALAPRAPAPSTSAAVPAAALAALPPADGAPPPGLPPPGTGDAAADDRFGERAFAMFRVLMRSQLASHNIFGGVQWRLTGDGIEVAGAAQGTGGRLVTVPRVWRAFGAAIAAAAQRHAVPVELIVATICTESGGNPAAIRPEPGWTSDTATPHRVSAGLMQTLISTARAATGNSSLTRQDLLDPATSIHAGTATIAQQRLKTKFDAPMVACAYNAGDVYEQAGANNRWRMRQYPIGTGHHADRFVQWFNDCFAFFTQDPSQLPHATPSLWRLFRS